MKILQTPVRFRPFIGGVENYVYNLSRGLVRLGHEVTVLCANEPKSEKEELMDGIRVKRLPYIGKIANTNITPSLPIEILREDFDLVHAHLPTPWSADLSAVFAKMKRKPLILTYHNDIVGAGFANRAAHLYNHTALKILLNRADRIIITQPKYLRSSPYLKRYEDKIVVIPVGVDVERFRPMHSDKINNSIFFLSVLDEFHQYKGLDQLLRALVLVKEEIFDVKLIVGGDGHLLEHYRRLSEDLGLGENVEFLGRVPEEMLANYYNRCDIFVLPSVSKAQEGFGMVLLEAMACGKPVVCTDIVGVADEVKAEGAGLIVETSNVDQLAGAMSYLLQNGSRTQKMGEVGRRLVEERYGWEKVAKKVEEVYEGLI
ncbi:MAG: glycosyltransferase family 4 protein [Methanothrix sp.]|nr:glycosyltransferase family 4 protein [Methanothrix sp.]